MDVVLVFVVGILLIGIGVWFATDENKLRWLLMSFMGVAMVAGVTFVVAPQEFLSGLPTTSIEAGEYGVAYVGPSAEGHVDVLTFEPGQESRIPKTYRRFPKEAFDGEINTEATKLSVVESDGFRKLVLK